MKALKHLNKYFYKYRGRFAAGIFIVFISNIFAVLPAPLVRKALDVVIDALRKHEQDSGAIFQKIIWFVVLILVVSLLRGFFLYLQRQLLIGLSRYIEFDLKNEIYSHYQKLPLAFYRKNNTGDLMARISEDVGQVRMYIGPAIMYGLNLLALFVIIVPFMFMVDAQLTLYVLLPLPFLSISIYYVNSMINKRSTKIQEGLSDLSTFVQEAFSGIRVLKAFGREKDSLEQLSAESQNFHNQSLKLTRVDAFFFPLILMLTGLSTILIIYIGGIEVQHGRISYGVIAEFIMYVNMLTWPVTSLGWTTSLVQRAEASQARINEFLRTETNIVSTNTIEKAIEGDIVFNKVTFHYPDSENYALKNISFRIPAGQTLAIIGATGSGKSTIANLLCRLYDPTSGSIEIDGINSKEYTLDTLRGQIGYVPQDVFLFSDTIRNNIAFGNSEADETQIVQAAKDADLMDNITSFPFGLNTILGERGITLSGGQKQRLSIARAIIRNPAVLILDDSLSAVDTKTENTILNSLKRIMRKRTSIIISHRVSSAKLADQILVLQDGEIVQNGNHDQLIEQEGFYKKLYKKQMEENN